NPGGSSVWYRWTPASDRTVTIDTFGSDFDTMLAIYTGANYGSLALVTSNDDLVGAGFTSRVRFSVFAGTTYQIAVDGFNGATGNVVLRLEPDRVDTAITSGPSGIMSSTSATFNFAASEPGSTFECSLNGAPFTSCVQPQKYSALAEQNYEFRVRAIDRGGRVDDTPATRAWTVDLTAPDTTIVSTPSGAVSSTSASFSFTSSQAGSTFQCALDNASFAYCISPTSFAGLSQGVHAFQVRAVDPAGNQDLSPASVSWTVDSIAPTSVSIDDPTIGETYQLATAFPVAWSGIDSSSGLADFDVSLRQGSYGQPLGSNTAWYKATTASGAAFSGVPGYTYCFSVRARDNAGNLSPTSADRCTAIPLDDTAFARKGSWSVKTGAGYYLNTYTSSAVKGASLTLPGLKAKRLALVATTCSTCGAVKVIWDGVVTGTISLTSPNTKKMQLISLAEFGSMKEGTLTLKTTSAKKVIVEGLGVSKV
ncbi:MAG TPA: hypothetical protein VEV82_00295, partial [Actinomycetota bacterium]|nr:hypothetical protein [Actinomycetota bacterium]